MFINDSIKKEVLSKNWMKLMNEMNSKEMTPFESQVYNEIWD